MALEVMHDEASGPRQASSGLLDAPLTPQLDFVGPFA